MRSKGVIAGAVVVCGAVSIGFFIKHRDKQARGALRDARTAFAAEKYEEAAAGFERCAKLNARRLECWMGAGHSNLALSRFPAAVAAYDAAVRRAPSDFAALSSRATANWLIGKPALAEPDYKRALEANPSHGLTAMQLHKVFAEQKKYDEAAEYWSGLAKSAAPGWAPLYWMQSLYLAGKWTALKELTADKKDPLSRYYAGAAELRLGSKAEAKRIFDSLAGKLQFPDTSLDKQYGEDMLTACAALKDHRCVAHYRAWLETAGL